MTTPAPASSAGSSGTGARLTYDDLLELYGLVVARIHLDRKYVEDMERFERPTIAEGHPLTLNLDAQRGYIAELVALSKKVADLAGDAHVLEYAAEKIAKRRGGA